MKRQIKRTIAILLLVCFVVSATAVAVSAARTGTPNVTAPTSPSVTSNPINQIADKPTTSQPPSDTIDRHGKHHHHRPRWNKRNHRWEDEYSNWWNEQDHQWSDEGR
jgi:hypothetical protein